MDSNWQVLHENLKDNLEQEIRLMRELLSNMHQEELSLMLSDVGHLNHILQVRSEMIEKLSAIRLFRNDVTCQISKMASSTHIDKILPPADIITTEILSLSDQLVALTEKMNRQQTQNQRLELHPDRYIPPQIETQLRPQKKASVATLQLKK